MAPCADVLVASQFVPVVMSLCLVPCDWSERQAVCWQTERGVPASNVTEIHTTDFMDSPEVTWASLAQYERLLPWQLDIVSPHSYRPHEVLKRQKLALLLLWWQIEVPRKLL